MVGNELRVEVLGMSYYFAKKVSAPFEEALGKVRKALKGEGFGILTEIDVKATMKKKLDVDFRKYTILGACNASFAHRALTLEDKIGTMLPCNVVVQEMDDGTVEVAAIDPVASMASVENPDLRAVGGEVREKLRTVIEGL